jgi:hypothetical protein
LVFLRYLDESYSDRRTWLERESRDALSVYFSLDEERAQLLARPDAYQAAGIAFIVPAARWERLQRQASAADPGNLGKAIDAILITVVRHNPRLEGVFPDDYSDPALSRPALSAAILSISRIAVPPAPPTFQVDRYIDEVRTPADALALICQGFLAEASSATEPVTNRLRVRTPPPGTAPEYTQSIARLDHQLRELRRILGRPPLTLGGREPAEGE